MKLTKSGRIEDFITSGRGRERGEESVDISESRSWIETSGRDDAAIFGERDGRDWERDGRESGARVLGCGDGAFC